MRRRLTPVWTLLAAVLVLPGVGALTASCAAVSTSEVAQSPLSTATPLEAVQSPPATPTPLPAPTFSIPTPTLFEPPTPPPTVTPLPLPVVTPGGSGLGVWVLRPTYSAPPPFLEVEFETARWRLDSEDPAYPVLIHRELAGCQIVPDVGRGLPEDYSVSQAFREIGSIAYQLNAVSHQDELIYMNYCALDVAEDVSTCFRVSFQDYREACIRDAEIVLATLQVITGE